VSGVWLRLRRCSSFLLWHLININAMNAVTALPCTIIALMVNELLSRKRLSIPRQPTRYANHCGMASSMAGKRMSDWPCAGAKARGAAWMRAGDLAGLLALAPARCAAQLRQNAKAEQTY